MADSNPYSPPKAEVDDIDSQSHRFQEVNVWSATGRIGRLRYLSYTFGGCFVANWLVTLLQYALASAVGPLVIPAAGYGVLVIFMALTTIKRSHDMNWSGWTALLVLIPFVGLIWLFKSGSSNENDYGDPPPPNTPIVKIIGSILPVLFALGIIAAIALPAYQNYVKRAQAAQHLHQ